MAYGGFKDFARRTASDKILRDKAFGIAKNPKYIGYQKDLASMVWNIEYAIQIYPIYIIAERFIRTLKNKISKYMTSISLKLYNDKLGDVVKKYNNTYHKTIKMKPVHVKSNTYINSSKEINDKDHKLKVANYVRILKYKKTFLQKTMFQISLKKFLLLQKLNILFCGHMLLVILKTKKMIKRKKIAKNKLKRV